MQKTLLCGLILLTAPNGALVGDLCPPRQQGTEMPGAAFQCPQRQDGADARFCCGPCSSPYCCSSEKARLEPEECLPESQRTWSEAPDAATTTGDSSTSPTTTEGHRVPTTTSVSVQKTMTEHQLNGLYFVLAMLGFLGIIYVAYYGCILRKYPISTHYEPQDDDVMQPPVAFSEDNLDAGPLRFPAVFRNENNEYIEMQDLGSRGGFSGRSDSSLAMRPPPYEHNDDPPPYSEHTLYPLAGMHSAPGSHQRKDLRSGCDNVGYCAEEGRQARQVAPLVEHGQESNHGAALERESEPAASAALERGAAGGAINLLEGGAGLALAAAGPHPETVGGGAAVPEGDEGGVAVVPVAM